FESKEAEFVFYTISCGVALVGNFAFFMVVIKVKSMRTVPNVFFMNLSLADAIFMAYYVIYLSAYKWQIKSVLLFHSGGGHAITDVGFCSSLLTVALISINRYVAICYPFKAEKLRLQSRSRVVASITISWIFSIAIGLLDFFAYGSEYQETLIVVLLSLMFICIIFSIAVVVVTYVVIATKMMKKKPRYAPAANNGNSYISEEIHVLLLCVAITAIFVISCAPLATVYIVATVNKAIGRRSIPLEKIMCLSYVARLMLSLHFTLNPILYNIGSRNHRAAFRKVFWPRKRHPPVNSIYRDVDPSPLNSSNMSMTMSTYGERSVLATSNNSL
ncbi:kappa-type opioid receptor-like, partial [Saccoglossus kowalevskii]